MTIGGWFVFTIAAVIAIVVTVAVCICANNKIMPVISILACMAVIAGVFFGLRWYFTSTAAGQRKIIDQRSNLGGGIERTINVYTANGDTIASYTGKIDIEDADGGYVKFDYDGKRYIYYNCFVETVAELEEQ